MCEGWTKKKRREEEKEEREERRKRKKEKGNLTIIPLHLCKKLLSCTINKVYHSFRTYNVATVIS